MRARDKSFARAAHGNGKGAVLRIEVPPVDELSKGLQAAKLASSTTERDEGGRFRRGASTAQSAGGEALREMTRLARRLTLGETLADPRFEPYARAARAFRRAQVTALARDVGGGHCGPAPASVVASASLQLAASRFAFEILGDLAMGSRLADASRQNLLAAHELTAREALARNRPGVRGAQAGQRTIEHDALVRQRVAEASARAVAPAGFDDDLDEETDP